MIDDSHLALKQKKISRIEWLKQLFMTVIEIFVGLDRHF